LKGKVGHISNELVAHNHFDYEAELLQLYLSKADKIETDLINE